MAQIVGSQTCPLGDAFLSYPSNTVDRMYGHEPPTKLKIRELSVLEQCPVSGTTGTRMPTSHLDRWKAVTEAVGEWYRTDPGDTDISDIESRTMGWMDTVQREIASQLFATFRQIMSRSEDQEVTFESAFSEVWDTKLNATIGATTQFSIEDSHGTEHFKIKTGLSRVSDEEAAVLIEGAEDPDSSFHEINLMRGEINEITMPENERAALISGLFAIPGHAEGESGTKPGLHCYQCSGPTRCGQYPSVDLDRANSESRGVLVSKKWLAKLSRCERQVAWARLFGIPKDDGADPDHSAQLGASFHEGAASALLADHPEAAFAAYASTAPGSEQADLLQLWENHKKVMASDELEFIVRDTEYGIGATFHAPGPFVDSRGRERERTVAVTFAGLADVVGRESDDTPAVIELRTGGGSSLPFEPEMYALGAHLLTGKAPVAVHTHRIGNPDDLECERRLFGESELQDAKAVLWEAAATVASWRPDNALSPDYTVGEWCTWCPFEARCSSYRV